MCKKLSRLFPHHSAKKVCSFESSSKMSRGEHHSFFKWTLATWKFLPKESEISDFFGNYFSFARLRELPSRISFSNVVSTPHTRGRYCDIVRQTCSLTQPSGSDRKNYFRFFRDDYPRFFSIFGILGFFRNF